MATSKKEADTAYKQARDAFDGLKMEEKAVFLVESVVHTLARGLEDAGKAVADAFEGAFQSMKEEEAAEEAPPKKTTRKKTTRTTKRTTRSKPKTDDDAAA